MPFTRECVCAFHCKYEYKISYNRSSRVFLFVLLKERSLQENQYLLKKEEKRRRKGKKIKAIWEIFDLVQVEKIETKLAIV